MEYVDSLHLFACTNKLDRLGNNGADTQRSTATGVAIELGEHNAIEIQTVVEFLCCVYSILTSHRVYYEQCFIRIESLLERRNLVHHFLVNSQSTGGIHDYYIVTLSLSLLDGIVGDGDNILAIRF